MLSSLNADIQISLFFQEHQPLDYGPHHSIVSPHPTQLHRQRPYFQVLLQEEGIPASRKFSMILMRPNKDKGKVGGLKGIHTTFIRRAVTRLRTRGGAQSFSLLLTARARSFPSTGAPQFPSSSLRSLPAPPPSFPSPLPELTAPKLTALSALSAPFTSPPLAEGGALWVGLYGDWWTPDQLRTRN